MKCPHCGAEIDNNEKKCQYCGSEISLKMQKEQEELNKTGCPKCKSTNIRFSREKQGEVRGKNKKQIVYRTIGICNDCGNTWVPNQKNEKQSSIWLWVFGWLFFFPIPLTVILARSKKLSKKAKIISISIVWGIIILYTLVIGILGYSGSTTSGVSSNIKSFDFLRDEIEVTEGKTTSSSWVKVELKDKNSFTPDDVEFISENEDIAVIRFEKDALTTYLYYVVDGISPGETTVYVKSKDGAIQSEHIKVTVKDDGLIYADSIVIHADKDELILGETIPMSIEASPAGSIVKEVSWDSSDKDVIQVDDKGVVKAIAEGNSSITAKISDDIQATYEMKVDGTKKSMNVRVSHPRDDDYNIGDEWTYYNEINGEKVTSKQEISIGDTLELFSEYTESDDNPDVGSAKKTYTVTEDDFINGFTVDMDVYVKENGGKNSGKKAHFIVSYIFTPN